MWSVLADVFGRLCIWNASSCSSCDIVFTTQLQAMQQLLTRVGGPKAQMKPQVESALTQLAQDLVGQALSFGCSMARRRQAPGGGGAGGGGAAAEDLVLQPADLAAFLEQTWYGLHLLSVFFSAYKCIGMIPFTDLAAFLGQTWYELIDLLSILFNLQMCLNDLSVCWCVYTSGLCTSFIVCIGLMDCVVRWCLHTRP